MEILPAIDLKGGRCVRLLRGDFAAETVYGDDPPAMATRWAAQGARWIHIVDLDGSVGQKPINQKAILAIRRAVGLKIELGGGIRDLKTISFYLENGLNRIILGTIAHKKPTLVKEAARLYPGRIAVGLDAKGSEVMVEGWTAGTGKSYLDIAKSYEDMGVATIIYTDIDRDGMQTGPNIERTRALAQAVRIPVIASGGVNDINDIKRLIEIEQDGVAGVITGKALYEGSLNLKEALALTL